jgi:hypothetical protein
MSPVRDTSSISQSAKQKVHMHFYAQLVRKMGETSKKKEEIIAIIKLSKFKDTASRLYGMCALSLFFHCQTVNV